MEPQQGQTRVACIQMRPDVGEQQKNLDRSLEFCERSVAEGAKLIVLPELMNSGYSFETREEAISLAEDIPNGKSVNTWIEFCRDNRTYLVAGMAEHDGNKLFNSSVVLGPDGHIGTYRKVHLWNRENLFFESGDLGFPVFHTSIGRISTIICYDIWFPEAARECALQGADIICIPTNWVPIPGQADGERAMATVLCQASSHTNSVYVAAADRVGTERGQLFNGESLIVSYTGWPVSGPASPGDEEIVFGDLDLGSARSARRWNDFNDPIRDRRPETYRAMSRMA